jgi:hypothetical protein
MRKTLFFTAILPVLAACWTVSVEGPKQVLIPEGEPVVATLTSDSVREGELLAVTNTELILKERGRLMAVSLPAVRKVFVKRYEISVADDWIEKLTLYCRYPQGLSGEQWRLLLRESGQEDFMRQGGN